MRLSLFAGASPMLAVCLSVMLLACAPGPVAPTSVSTAALPAEPSATPTATPEGTTIVPDEPAVEQPATPTPTPTRTPTPTLEPAPVATKDTSVSSRCVGLSGELEVQVLVGPAEAVGLEPVAVGSVPFAVTRAEPPYLVEGAGPIDYEAVLPQEWGDYAVTMNLDLVVRGECAGQPGTEALALMLDMTGEQLVTVTFAGQQQQYPWSGTQSLELAFPLQEDARAEGEGWAVVLHLGTQ